jgi:signal transduction histidine kinase
VAPLVQPVPPALRWQLGARGRRWFDVLLVLVLLLPTLRYAAIHRPLPGALSVLEILPLTIRRPRPVETFAAVAVVTGAQALLLDIPTWGQVAFPVATYSLARFAGGRLAQLGLGVGLVASVVASVVWLAGYDAHTLRSSLVPYFLTISAIVVTSWTLGTLGRTREAYVDAVLERGERIEREAAHRIELAASEERARIAREMHDVVAHGLSVIVVQADGARYAAERDPAVATATLATVSETGRAALTEMRRLLGLLRSGDATGLGPQPGLAEVKSLVDEARAAGTEVEADLTAGDDVPDGAALTAYRVVQEALSNVRKHAGPGAAARVRVAVRGDHLVVEIADDGRGAASATSPDHEHGPGLGLLGMRERVSVHDGTLETGPRPGGGFAVRARIPL